MNQQRHMRTTATCYVASRPLRCRCSLRWRCQPMHNCHRQHLGPPRVDLNGCKHCCAASNWTRLRFELVPRFATLNVPTGQKSNFLGGTGLPKHHCAYHWRFAFGLLMGQIGASGGCESVLVESVGSPVWARRVLNPDGELYASTGKPSRNFGMGRVFPAARKRSGVRSCRLRSPRSSILVRQQPRVLR